MGSTSFPIYSKDDNDEIELVLDMRQNVKSEWTSIRSNTSKSPFVQNVSTNGIVRKIQFLHFFCSSSLCDVDIRVQVQFKQCLNDSEKPTFRCRFLSRNRTVEISEDVQLPLKGENDKRSKIIFD